VQVKLAALYEPVVVIAVPVVPETERDPGVTAGTGAAATDRLTVAVAVPGELHVPEPVAVMVKTVEVRTALGVPEMVPVDVEKEIPAGKADAAGLIEYEETVQLPPKLVGTRVVEVRLEPTVPLRVCELGTRAGTEASRTSMVRVPFQRSVVFEHCAKTS
jgi:hypothetical protein